MLFPSVLFLAYFLPAALLLYLVCSFSRLAQNVCLLAISLVFYAWGEPLHLVPLVYVILVTWGLGLLLGGNSTLAYRRRIVAVAVVLIVSMLVFMRYGTALSLEFSGLTGLAPLVILPDPPLGLSFFSLQGLAYIFDNARGKTVPEKNILNVGLYIALFPTVLAGPVVRFADIGAQILHRRVTGDLLGKGCTQYVVGLAKLVLLAGPASAIAEHVFTMSTAGPQAEAVPVMLAWLGLFAFSLQVYFAFSGYADMAIGIAAMFGFSIRKNFDYPYTARTVTDFWRRWNISLYRWFYLYVFIALGGARPKQARVRGVMRPRNFILRNLFVMWLLLGLWYGISWTYFYWAMWFFVVCLFEWIVRLPHRKLGSPAWHVYVLLTVCFGWIFFRCHSVGESMNYIANMFGLGGNGFYSDLAALLFRENWLPLLLGVLCCLPIGKKAKGLIRYQTTGVVSYPAAVLYPLVLIGLFCLSLVYVLRDVRIPFVL